MNDETKAALLQIARILWMLEDPDEDKGEEDLLPDILVRIHRLQVEREDALREQYDLDAKLTQVRLTLSAAGIPESEPYPPEDVSDWERSLRTGGRMLAATERIERLRAERDAARKERDLTRYAEGELARVVRERDEARAYAAHLWWVWEEACVYTGPQPAARVAKAAEEWSRIYPSVEVEPYAI